MRKRIKQTSTTIGLAVAAFAVSLTSVQAFGNQEFLTKAGLTDEQVVAVQEARELRKGGDIVAARDILLEAGITVETIHTLREAHHAHRQAKRMQFIREQLTDEQYDALSVANSANDRAAVRAILEEAGFEGV
jgi:hypothetical protein